MTKIRNALRGVAVFGLSTAIVQGSAAAMEGSQKRPGLYEFIELTTQGHPSLMASEAALTAARARARGQARPIYNPELEIGYENAEASTKEIGISQAFDWSGKRRARSGVGRAEVEAAEAIYELARKTLLTDIFQALSDYHTMARIFTVAEEREKLNEKFLSLAKRQNDAGEMSRAEFLTARLALAEARVAKNTAAGQLSVVEERLIAKVGQNRQVWPRLDGVPINSAVISGTINYEQLPELRLAQAKTEISRALIKVAKTDRMPDPTVGVRVGEEGRSTLVGLSLSMPIPVRNSYRAEVRAAGAELIAAQQDYHSVNRQIRARYDASLNRYFSASDAWHVWRSQGAEPLNEQRTLLGKLVEARDISAVNYLVQLNQTFATETASIELKGRLWNAWFDWQNAGGTISEWLETIQ